MTYQDLFFPFTKMGLVVVSAGHIWPTGWEFDSSELKHVILRDGYMCKECNILYQTSEEQNLKQHSLIYTQHQGICNRHSLCLLRASRLCSVFLLANGRMKKSTSQQMPCVSLLTVFTSCGGEIITQQSRKREREREANYLS